MNCPFNCSAAELVCLKAAQKTVQQHRVEHCVLKWPCGTQCSARPLKNTARPWAEQVLISNSIEKQIFEEAHCGSDTLNGIRGPRTWCYCCYCYSYHQFAGLRYYWCVEEGVNGAGGANLPFEKMDACFCSFYLTAIFRETATLMDFHLQKNENKSTV